MRLLHISDDPGETGRAPIGDSLLGDAVLSLAALTDRLAGRPRSNGKAPARVEAAAPRTTNRPADGLAATEVFAALNSFQYSVQSIWSAAHLKLPMLILLMRNVQYTILKSFAALEQTPGVPGLDLPGMDLVSIARGYGCDAARIDDLDALKRAAANAWANDVPTVLEVPVSGDVPRLV
jgi:Thiamine pyrophosphate enzyme, C-terminal TPP binding domain